MPDVFIMFSVAVENLGDTFAGWRITARCGWGKREDMTTKREVPLHART
jgi:hypothetical protein